MSAYRTWEFHGHNNDGTPLTSKQIECLVAVDEFDLDCIMNWEQGEEMFGWGDTSSIGAYERIEEALGEFAKIYPEAVLQVFCTYETEPCPDGFMVKGGKVRPFSGHVVYTYDDDGTAVEE